jgi:hypothetical protein
MAEVKIYKNVEDMSLDMPLLAIEVDSIEESKTGGWAFYSGNQQFVLPKDILFKIVEGEE